MENCINSITDTIKSAEFRTFPCYLILPNAQEFFGDKIKSVTEKVLSPYMYERLYFVKLGINQFQNERATVLP